MDLILTSPASEIIFRDDVVCDLVQVCANDEMVVKAARVSTGAENDPVRNAGLINYLISNAHNSPAEHTLFTFYIEIPIFVARELVRHRIGVGYSEASGRYRELLPHFYIPNTSRKLRQVGKPGHYTFVEGSVEDYEVVDRALRVAAQTSWDSYQVLLDQGIAREVSRLPLPVNIYTQLFVSFNARSLMHFLDLRIGNELAPIPSYPQREIEMLAEKMEEAFSEHMPLTHKAWSKKQGKEV